MQSIINSIIKSNENNCTEVLTSLLKFKYNRDVFLRHLKVPIDIWDELNAESIKTQVYMQTIGIPDIIIESNSLYLLIEVKIRNETILQNNQIENYKKILESKDKRIKKLFFLIPENYYHINTISRLTKSEKNIDIIFWENVLELFRNTNALMNSSIDNQLYSFIENSITCNKKYEPFTIKEIAIMYDFKNVYSTLNMLNKSMEIFEKSCPLIVQGLGEDFKCSDTIKYFSETIEKGKYITYKDDRYAIFYGFNLNLLKINEDFTNYVFSVSIKDEYITKDKLDRNGYDYIEEDHWIYIKIDDKDFLENSDEHIFSDCIKKIISNSI
ncbi:MAG TPA: hypothetical protein PLG67_09410 [Bacillota bacterium]|nr:hypothetical protein [Bacillota bacterium]